MLQKQRKQQQSAPSLRRRKRTNSIWMAGGSELQTTVVVLLVIFFLCFAGFSYEFFYNNNNNTSSASSSVSSSSSLRKADSSDVAPVLPIFAPVPNAETLIADTLHNNRPTVRGVKALMQKFLSVFHVENMKLANEGADAMEIINKYFELSQEYLGGMDAAYRDRPIFPIREDGSVFLSLAAFREHLLSDTLQFAFSKAKNPEKLFVGVVVQNCFGKVSDDGKTIDPSGTPCRTGAQVVGKDKNGHDTTKVSDAPPDRNGIEEFCAKPEFQKYCSNGQLRVLYVHETESLGPAVARYYASKLWGGETYFMQCDSHLMFAQDWDEKYRAEIQASRNYPKSVLSSYPPGFQGVNENSSVRESKGTMLCYCETRVQDPNPIVRINTGGMYSGDEPRPLQIPFIAAGFFFTRAEFLVDVPFDPYMPWIFMGEEIALSMRAWTHGWDIYAPRKNLIAHQYRPGRMGLPKFWGTVNRLYRKSKLGNNKLQGRVIKRTKHMVGYPDSTLEKIHEEGIDIILTDIEHYGLGSERSWEDYMTHAAMHVNEEHDAIDCSFNMWCSKKEKD